MRVLLSATTVATLEEGSVKLATGVVTNVGSTWQTVTLPNTYNSMVVVASVNYGAADLPAVTRVRNAAGSSG